MPAIILASIRPRRCEQRSRSGKEIWRKGHPHWHICGIPEVLYTDNGSDFTSKHLEQVEVDLKIRLVFSTPGKPQGRGRIERFFRTVNAMFLCELDGYIRRRRHKPSLSLQRFEELSQTFLLETYHRRVSVNGRLIPSERWVEGGFLPRMPESLEQLDLVLTHEVSARKVLAIAFAFTDLGLRCQPTSLFYVFMQLRSKLLHNWTEIVGSCNEFLKAIGRLLHDVSRTYAEHYRQHPEACAREHVEVEEQSSTPQHVYQLRRVPGAQFVCCWLRHKE